MMGTASCPVRSGSKLTTIQRLDSDTALSSIIMPHATCGASGGIHACTAFGHPHCRRAASWVCIVLTGVRNLIAPRAQITFWMLTAGVKCRMRQDHWGDMHHWWRFTSQAGLPEIVVMFKPRGPSRAALSHLPAELTHAGKQRRCMLWITPPTP